MNLSARATGVALHPPTFTASRLGRRQPSSVPADRDAPADGGARLVGLDALRGTAIALVMLRHAFSSVFQSSGIEGVVIFFALSGYLITGLIVGDIERFGTVRWRRFYAHRACRLYPALLALLLTVLVVGLTSHYTGGTRIQVLESVGLGAVYLTDMPIHVVAPLQHLWTLAIEEQFYLVWPLLLRRFYPRGRAGALIVAGIALSLVGAVTAALSLHDPEQVYRFPACWTACLLLGAAARIYRPRLVSWASSNRILGVGAAFLVVLTVVPDTTLHPAAYIIGGPVVALVATVLAVRASETRTLPAVGWAFALLGLFSYAAYLWNAPVAQHLTGGSTTVERLVVDLGSIAVTLVFAGISWFTVEAFGRRLRRRLDHPAVITL